MSDITTNIFLGWLWVNYGPNVYWGLGPRITVLDKTANIILSGLAVWITLWSPGYWALFIALVKRISPRHFYNLIKDTRTAEDCTLETSRSLFASVRACKLEDVWLRRVVLVLVSFGIFISLSVGAIYVAYLALDTSCISTSPSCGFWNPDPRVNHSARPPGTVPMGDIVIKAETVDEECFESDPVQRSCPLFTESELPNTVMVNASCPFTNASMCLLGPDSAIGFDTGYTPGTDIGINVPPGQAPSFRAYMTCAPIVLEGFYREINTTDNITTIRFFYGPRPNDPSTFNQTRSLLFEATFSPTGIELKVMSERLAEFVPIPSLQGRNPTEYAVLAFISIFNIQYPEPNPDPIFGATTAVPCPTNNNTSCYHTTDLPARVLGCVESAVLCPPGARDATRCLDVFAHTNITALFAAVRVWAADAGADRGASWLLAQGLYYGDLADTVATRHGLILNATKGIDGNRVSLPLDPRQWQVEAQRLFEIGLLRVKMEMLAVVQGMRANWVGYVDVLQLRNSDVDVAKEVCPKYRFVCQGVTDISFVGLFAAIFVPMIVGWWVNEKPMLYWVWLALNFVWRLLEEAVGNLYSRKRRTQRVKKWRRKNNSTDVEMGIDMDGTEIETMGPEIETVGTKVETVGTKIEAMVIKVQAVSLEAEAGGTEAEL